MRHTLLPREEKKVLRREYRVRTLIVLCFALSTALVIGMGALFPSFIRSATEKNEAIAQVEALKKDNIQNGVSEIKKKLTEYTPLLSSLSENENYTMHSSFIDIIASERGAVSINSISVASTASTTMNVAVAGVAPTRDSLLSFKTRLEIAFPSAKIELPLSELAKSSKIPFNMRLIVSIR